MSAVYYGFWDGQALRVVVDDEAMRRIKEDCVVSPPVYRADPGEACRFSGLVVRAVEVPDHVVEMGETAIKICVAAAAHPSFVDPVDLLRPVDTPPLPALPFLQQLREPE